MSADRHLRLVGAEVVPLHDEPITPSPTLREFIEAHLALMTSVPDPERPTLAAKARRFGDAYARLMREINDYEQEPVA